MMKRMALAWALLSLGACATGEPTAMTEIARGHALAQTQCAACHATGLYDESRAPEAPAFRRLSETYRVANLEEALAEGISVGHPAMPAFVFAPEDADALIAYLQSIQDRR
jgi:cytochrome c